MATSNKQPILPPQEFDIKKFNKEFEDQLLASKEATKKREEERLKKLNVVQETKPISELTIAEILIGIKDTWFGIIDDLLNLKFNMTTITSENRLFYIGLTIIIIVILTYIINHFVNLGNPTKQGKEKIIKIYHINNSNISPNEYE